MIEVAVSELQNKCEALTASAGGHLAESASMCFARYKHANPVDCEIKGLENTNVLFEWLSVTPVMRRTYGDEDENTEHGACGLAILLVRQFTAYEVVHRARKWGGFDYWLGFEAEKDPNLFRARLEVSGIGEDPTEQGARIRARVKQKLDQTQASDESVRLPAIVVVVEFSRPVAVMKERSG